MLPKVTGVELLKRCHNQGFNTPVLVVTSRVEEESVDAGADDCIFKPFDLGEFIARSRLPISIPETEPTASFLFREIECLRRGTIDSDHPLRSPQLACT